jgi:hypothetical protein
MQAAKPTPPHQERNDRSISDLIEVYHFISEKYSLSAWDFTETLAEKIPLSLGNNPIKLMK